MVKGIKKDENAFSKTSRKKGADLLGVKPSGGRQGAFYDEHRNRTFYVRRDLNEVLVQQQDRNGRGTTHKIINEALEEYMKAKGWISGKNEGEAHAEGEEDS